MPARTAHRCIVTGPPSLLQITGLTKRFGPVTALQDVLLSVQPGTVHCLVGENGAGKSTLLRTLAGALAPDEGEIVFDGRALAHDDGPRSRQQAGLVSVYQELNLLPEMSVAENMFLGREPTRYGFIDWRRMVHDARATLDTLGVDIDPRVEVRTLSIAQQQMVEIAKGFTHDAKLIVMDEPTAALSAREVEALHRLVRDLCARGIAVIYVTHRLQEVKDLGDRYTVLRDGRFVAEGDVADVSVNDLIRLMVGRDVEFAPLRGERTVGAPVLRVEGLSRRRRAHRPHAVELENLSLEVRAGEIVGIAGLVGAGRTEFARAVFGADRCDAGTITLAERTSPLPRSPRSGIAAGIYMLPEDRKHHGCFLDHSIRQNMTLPSLKRFSRWGAFVDGKAERAAVEHYKEALRIKMSDPEAPISSLSGGNQQKVLLARSMMLEPRVLIVDEPTRGVDVGAKAEVHQHLAHLAASGISVIVISSELPEILAISDRIITFCNGCVTDIVAGAGADETMLMERMTPGSPYEAAARARAHAPSELAA